MIRTDDVAHLAEQATLGGLLLEPAHFPDVNAWVRGPDFADPWHRQVWVTLREAHTHGVVLGPIELADHMLRRYEPRLADIPRIHDLLQAVPKNPDPRPHARAVAEFGIRREIAGQGVLIEAAAVGAATHLEARPLRALLRIAGAGFLIAGERWADANGHPNAHLTDHLPTQLKAGACDLELRRAADKSLAHAPAPDTEGARANEARLVACLASHPTAIAPTLGWLRPGQLTNRAWATVYTALGEIAGRGGTIDDVSLATSVLLVAARTHTAPSLDAMRTAIEAEVCSVPGHLRQVVAADHLRLLAHNGAQVLRTGAANPATHVLELLDTATALIQSMSQTATALPDQIGQPPRSNLSIMRNPAIDPSTPQGGRRDGPVAE
ncbi:MAG: DnaB-like helicase N-terminal domain-containing protein [Cellulomonas sp.]